MMFNNDNLKNCPSSITKIWGHPQIVLWGLSFTHNTASPSYTFADLGAPLHCKVLWIIFTRTREVTINIITLYANNLQKMSCLRIFYGHWSSTTLSASILSSSLYNCITSLSSGFQFNICIMVVFHFLIFPVLIYCNFKVFD